MPKGSYITQCRVCDSTALEPAIDLGSQPWCNHFLKPEDVGSEPCYPLRVVYCHKCAVPQLDYTVPKGVMFADHTYLSGVTRTLSEHFAAVAQDVDFRFFKDVKGKCVLDIGSNDGTQLRHFKALGYDVLGVESAKALSAMANGSGINTIHAFFNLDLVQRMGRRFHVINAAGVFFHLEELHSATEAVREALGDDGIFVVQFLYMKAIVENGAFDQIYHEHLLYYNLQTIEILLNRHGLSMFDAYLAPIHGGSVIGFVAAAGSRQPSARLQELRRMEKESGSNCFSTYLSFAERTRRLKEKNLRYLGDAKRSGKMIWGFGAPAKGNTLLNYFGVGTQYLDCLVERNVLRRGLYSPGMHIPIVLEKDLSAAPDIYYVLAWNFKKEILANNEALLRRGVEFYFPVTPTGW